jgi:hypothetical protein
VEALLTDSLLILQKVQTNGKEGIAEIWKQMVQGDLKIPKITRSNLGNA